MPIPLKDDEPPFDPDTRLLHIIAQHTYHGEAFIAGNQAALKVLRDTIDAALNSPAKSFYSVQGHPNTTITPPAQFLHPSRRSLQVTEIHNLLMLILFRISFLK